MAQIPLILKNPLQNYINELAQEYQLGIVILFGSMAQGTYHQDSDIDLAIFSEDVTVENEIDIMANCLLKAMPYKLDIQPLVFPLSDYEADNDFIQDEIIKQGIQIPLPVAEFQPAMRDDCPMPSDVSKD